ncbi:hypothetical protein ACLI4Z_02915 [Natrialbaceae archaeon A-arb3/5]
MSDPNSNDSHRGTDTHATTDSSGGSGPDAPSNAETDPEARPGNDRDPRDESTQIANEERRRKTSVVSAVIAALGAWVALSVLIFDVGEASLWNNVLVGAIVFVGAGYNFYRISNDVPLSVGVASLVAILGIWLIVSAALLGMLGSLFWSTLASGLLIAGLAGYNAYEAREARTVATDQAGA